MRWIATGFGLLLAGAMLVAQEGRRVIAFPVKSSHVARVRVVKVESSPWEAKGENGLRKRVTTLDLAVERVMKGRFDPSPGEAPIQLEVEQWHESSAFGQGVPGFWSEFELKAGQKLIVMGNTVAEFASFFRKPIACVDVDVHRGDAADIEFILETAAKPLRDQIDALRGLLDKAGQEHGAYLGQYAVSLMEALGAGADRDALWKLAQLPLGALKRQGILSLAGNLRTIVDSNSSGEGTLESIYSWICLRALTKLPDPPEGEDTALEMELVQNDLPRLARWDNIMKGLGEGLVSKEERKQFATRLRTIASRNAANPSARLLESVASRLEPKE